MAEPKVGDIWYTYFPHYDLESSYKHRTVIIMNFMQDKSIMVIEVTSDKGQYEGQYSERLNKDKFNLDKESFADSSTIGFVYKDSFKNFRSNVKDVDSDLWNKIRNNLKECMLHYKDNPWAFRTWCIVKQLIDCTYSEGIDELRELPVKSLQDVETTLEASDIDISLIVYDICKNNKKFKPRFLIIRFTFEDEQYDDMYFMSCSFKYKNKMYSFIMFYDTLEIVGPYSTFEMMNIETTKRLINKAIIKGVKTTAHIYNIHREQRINSVLALVKKSKSSMTRGLVIELLTEGEESKTLEESVDLMDKMSNSYYLFTETLQTLDLI